MADLLINSPLLGSVLTLIIIHFIATVSPGPDFMLISKEALTKGRKAGFVSMAGTLSGLSIHILYSALGLAAVLASSAQALLAIQLMGGGYLIYLGVKGLRAQPAQVSDEHDRVPFTDSYWQIFRAGFICDLLNPKAPVYFVTLFTLVLSPDMPVEHLMIYAGCILAIHSGWFTLVIVLLSTPVINKRFKQMSHRIDRVLGGAMLLIGMKLLAS
ncbi:LysE family translocator [Oceanospirillum sediminis]|uniref:LysE family translocator n=1 Tax=Oceanospirillum sediminis TaxID=2760088 RepID=A0A839IKY7_9GAMM|nr:LysE family translocator [Oceanospirillum sediminis]MBB1485157.1 LysE family translocator [Oceanospirillum sediminis]